MRRTCSDLLWTFGISGTAGVKPRMMKTNSKMMKTPKRKRP